MQPRNHDGSMGEVEPFDKSRMGELIGDEKVEHVEVFEGTEEVLKERRSLANDFSAAAKARKKRKTKNRQSRKSRKL